MTFGVNLDAYLDYLDFILARVGRTKSPGSEWHHIKPVYLGGTDGPENRVYLTPDEHREAHRLLVRIHPRSTPARAAARLISKETGSERARRLIQDGTHPFLDHQFQSFCQTRRLENGTHHMLGGQVQRSLQHRLANMGIHSAQKYRTCPKCGYEGRGPWMYRFHFDNCRAHQRELDNTLNAEQE
jgi:hypothetical protein